MCVCFETMASSSLFPSHWLCLTSPQWANVCVCVGVVVWGGGGWWGGGGGGWVCGVWRVCVWVGLCRDGGGRCVCVRLQPHNIITSSSVESGIMLSANRLKFDWRALW